MVISYLLFNKINLIVLPKTLINISKYRRWLIETFLVVIHSLLFANIFLSLFQKHLQNESHVITEGSEEF